MTYDIINPGPSLGQEQKCGWVYDFLIYLHA